MEYDMVMVFSHGHIAVTAAITGVISAGIGFWRLEGERRLLNGLSVGAVAGASVYLWRASANVPQLNADGLPGFSANDWLAPVVTFVSLGVLAAFVALRPVDRYGQVRAAATVVALAVNVITI
jgi:hypothetical protein